MIVVILGLLCITLYSYYTSLWLKGLVREFIVSAVLIALVAGLYGALTLGAEMPAVFSLMHQTVQSILQR